MIDQIIQPAQRLSGVCALLRRFDTELLNALQIEQEEIDTLLVSDVVVQVEDSFNTFRVPDDLRLDAIDWLRAHYPEDELATHDHALHYFLRRLRAANGDHQDTDEAEYAHHLDRLFFLLFPRDDWQTIGDYIQQARQIRFRVPQHGHQLDFYDGFIAVSTQHYDRAEVIFAALLDNADLSDTIRVRVFNGLALSFMYRNEYTQALRYFQEVATLAHRIDDHYYQAASLINMSMVYNDLGDHAHALQLCQESLAIFRAMHDHHRVAIALYELGNNALYLGRWDVARQHLAEAIALSTQLGLEARLSNAYWAQGLLNHLCGTGHTSEENYLRALAVARSPTHGDTKLVGDILWHLGFLYATKQRWEAALDAYDESIALMRAQHRRHWLSVITYQRGRVFERQGKIDLALDAYRAAIETLEALRYDTDDEHIKIRLLGTTQHLYESMVLLCLAHDQPAEAFNYVERARSRAFLDTITKREPDLYATLEQPVVTLAEVQAQLPPDVLLIEYYTTGVIPHGDHWLNNLPPENKDLRQHLTPPARLLFFAITHDQFEVHDASAKLDPNRLRPEPGDPAVGQHLLHEHLLPYLYTHLIAPVRHLMQGKRLLYIIPHGPLHYVPFMALRSPAGEHLLHTDGPAIAFAPSATILLQNCFRRPASPNDQGLALGYNGQDSGTLEYAEAEAYLVARLMNSRHVVGSAPKIDTLLTESSRLRWLHIACHAIYNPLDPLDSHVYLDHDRVLSARTIISQLHLRADLVTLSACMSGLSAVMAGDELLGLPRAFLYAGAPTVVCTLWEAPDLVALLVMEQFYLGLHAGQVPAAALRDALVYVRSMTVRGLRATIKRWRAADLPIFHTLIFPSLQDQQLDNTPFADPSCWAPFMVVGRG